MVKKAIIRVLAGVGVLVVPLSVWGVVGCVAYDMALHNLEARWLERQVAELSHPGDSDLVASLLDVGRLGGGNVQICELLAGELRRSELSGAEIREFYRHAATGNEPQIYLFDEPLSEANHIPVAYRMPRPGDAAALSRQPGHLYYAVYYYDSPDTLGADTRCW